MPITGKKGKYRDDMLLPTNIMKDPRVAKGSTYSAHHKKVKAEAQAILSRSIGGGERKEERRKPVRKKKSIYDYRPKEGGANELDLAPHLVEQVRAGGAKRRLPKPGEGKEDRKRLSATMRKPQ